MQRIEREIEGEREGEETRKAYECAEEAKSEKQGESDRSSQSGRVVQEREGLCESKGGGRGQTCTARDSICSHGLVLRHYKYLM